MRYSTYKGSDFAQVSFSVSLSLFVSNTRMSWLFSGSIEIECIGPYVAIRLKMFQVKVRFTVTPPFLALLCGCYCKRLPELSYRNTETQTSGYSVILNDTN